MDMEKIKSFTDLIAWKKGHQLVISIYKITDNFPQKEIFALTKGASINNLPNFISSSRHLDLKKLSEYI